jgi:hypothetical protein
MVDFAKLKSNSGKKSLQSLTQELNKVAGNEGSKEDERFWQPTADKAGNGYAVIRFLPAPGEEDVPFIRLFEHGFKGPGGWYIENSLTTIGKNDPVSDYNTKLWNSGIEANKEIARKQKRKLNFVSNVYVVHDSGNPDKEGKVFLFKYGKKIFDKLKEAMEPQFEDEEAVNPFDLWSGANFKLKIRQVEGYRNYDKSEFDKAGPLFEDDAKLEAVWKAEHSLQQFLAPTNFKTYEELQARLSKVLDERVAPAASKTAESVDLEDDAPSFKATHAPKFSGSSDDDEDDIQDFFNNLSK